MTVTISGSTGIQNVNGTASAPAESSGAGNTGLYFPTTTSVAIATNGVQAVAIDASQNFTFANPVSLSSATLSNPNITTGLRLTGAAGTSGQYLTSAGSGAAPTWTTLIVAGSGGATASGSVVLTSASAGAQSVTPTDYNQTVTLPSATTMTKGANVFTIQNAGQYPVKILNSSGSNLGFLYPYLTTVIGLADNSTAAGIWLLDSAISDVGVTSAKTFSGFPAASSTPIPVSLSATKTLVLITRSNTGYGVVAYDSSTNTYGSIVTVNTTDTMAQIIAVNATTALLATCVNGGSGTGINFYVLSVSGTTVTVGTVSTQTTTNTTYLGSWSAYSTVWAFSYWQNNTWNVIGINYSGTTITRGTPATSLGVGTYSAPGTIVTGTNCSALITYYNQVYFQPFTVNTSTLAITAGTQLFTNLASTNSYYTFRILNISTDNWVFVANGDSPAQAYYAIAFTTGSNAITKGTAVNIGTGPTSPTVTTNCDLAKISSTKFCFVYRDASDQTYVNLFTVSGTTITAGTAVRPYSIVAGSATPGLISVSGNNALFSLYISTTAAAKLVVDCSGASPVISSFIWGAGGSSYIVPPFVTSYDGATWGTGVYNNNKKTINQPNYLVPGYQNLNTPIWAFPCSSAYRPASYTSLVTLNATEMWGYLPDTNSQAMTLTRIESST
jgi:hypothetical protein